MQPLKTVHDKTYYETTQQKNYVNPIKSCGYFLVTYVS